MPFPVVTLDSIPTSGLTVAVGEWALVACSEAIGGVASRVGGQLTVVRQARKIVVRGPLSGAGTTVCGRCGEPVELALSGEVDCLYLPVDELASNEQDQGSEDEDRTPADQGEYDGVSLDLVHVVREFFALECPARPLCADLDPDADEACLTRFRAKAQLPPPEPDPRFAVLKGVKPPR